jgi:hypothetical protein
LLPYLISAVVIGVLLRKYQAEEIATQLQLGAPLWPVVIALFSVVVTLVLVSTADAIVVRGSCAPVTWWDMLRGKASSSLVDIFGYAFGHGGYAVWIQRITSARPAVAGGAMLYIMSCDLLAVCAVAGVASLFAPPQVASAVGTIAPAIAGVLALLMLLGPYQLFGKFAVTEPWATVPRLWGFANVALRIAQTTFWCLATWLGANAFGLEIPFFAMMTLFPVVMLVQALPVNVAGFGAVQGAWLIFSDFAGGEAILAFQLVWALAVMAGVVLRGLPFVRRVVMEVDRGQSS